MPTAAENERLTHVGPGTPMGDAFRRYWLPALLSEELRENDGAPVRVRMLGEDLVAFRDTAGRVGLVSAYCPHRRAPLFFGRNEEGGLRCVYHGWKFDRSGACTEMPSEPPDSLFKTKVRVEAYPTWEGGGLVWTYMGPSQSAPPPPDYEFVRAPATHRIVSKMYEECNYLPALEGGMDPYHSSILHSRNGGAAFLANYERVIPRIECRKTEYGCMYSMTRLVDAGRWTRVSHYHMPAMHLRATVQKVFRNDIVQPTMDGQLWVPIDDFHTWTYSFSYSYFPDVPLDPEYAAAIEASQGRGPGDQTPDFRLRRNRSNDYLIDRTSQRQGSFTGIDGVNTQDLALQEGMEPVVDRAKEHLGSADQLIILMRKLLLEAVDDVAGGRTPRGADPRSHDVRGADDFIPAHADWEEALREDLKTLY